MQRIGTARARVGLHGRAGAWGAGGRARQKPGQARGDAAAAAAAIGVPGARSDAGGWGKDPVAGREEWSDDQRDAFKLAGEGAKRPGAAA